MQFNGNKRYNDFSSFIRSKFSERVQKISLDTGFTCPNRDGSKGIGGCTYCNNNTFNPEYCKPEKSITQQLDEGIAFFSIKYKTQKYLAYFQAYTNTYADIKLVKELYLEAVNHPMVIGLVIGTRPDCIDKELIHFLSELTKKYFISLEFGVESTLNRTLESVNRCHTFEETIKAFEMSKNKGMHLGAHMIIGLPGESKEEILNHASELSKLPIQSLKLHQLQVVKHTMMAAQLKKTPEQFHLYGVDEYVDLITEFIARLRPDIIIERFISESPAHLLLAPKWGGLKNFEIVAKIDKRLDKNDMWQGKYYDA
jgi:uncharacterized protein